MSSTDTTFTIQRILVALDASPHSLAALEMAVDLAARLKAELAGLFVEDVELLRMADSPSAREIAYPSASHAPLNRGIMERKLRAQSEHIRKALAVAAHRAQIRWSFRSIRGHVTSALRDAATQHDIVAAGRLGWSLGQRPRIGSTALGLATSDIPLLLISERAAFSNLRLVVYYDGSRAAKDALLVAAKLAHAGTKGITVLVSAADYEHELGEIHGLLRGQGLEIRCRRIDLENEMSLLRALKEEGAILLVLASRQLLKDREAFEAILRKVDLPLLLLGGGFHAPAQP